MAIKWPVANGNWSNEANWNGGTKPVPGDVVYADGKTITIDEDVTVAELRTDERSGGTAGGGFSTSGKVVVAADTHAGTTWCLGVTVSATQNGDSYGGSTTLAYGTEVHNGGIQNGDSYGGSGPSSYGTLATTGGIQNGNSHGGGGSAAHGTSLSNGGIQYGDAIGGLNGAGTRVSTGGVAIIRTVRGANARGLFAAGIGQIAVIQQEIGENAKSVDANTDTTYDNIPFAKPPALNTYAAMALGNRLAQRGVNL